MSIYFYRPRVLDVREGLEIHEGEERTVDLLNKQSLTAYKESPRLGFRWEANNYPLNKQVRKRMRSVAILGITRICLLSFLNGTHGASDLRRCGVLHLSIYSWNKLPACH
jgi:hypothetical protein